MLFEALVIVALFILYMANQVVYDEVSRLREEIRALREELKAKV